MEFTFFQLFTFISLGVLCFSGPLESLWFLFLQNELAAILRFGAEELFKDDKNIEEAKTTLENMDIDQILARAEKVETKTANEVDGGNELLNAFKVSSAPLFLDTHQCSRLRHRTPFYKGFVLLSGLQLLQFLLASSIVVRKRVFYV